MSVAKNRLGQRIIIQGMLCIFLLSGCSGSSVQKAAVESQQSPVSQESQEVLQQESEQNMTITEPAIMKAYNLPEGFVYVDDVVPNVVLDIRYATQYNFTNDVIDGYNEPLAILSVEAANALKIAADLAAQDGWVFRIYDAYRPKQAIECISAWELTDENTLKADFYPNLEKAALFTDGYLSKYSRHTRGSTVDLTLQDENGNLIDMGSTYDMLDPVSNYDSPDITEEQRQNRYYLRNIMDKAGFDTIATEWWHFQLRNEPYPTEYFDFFVE